MAFPLTTPLVQKALPYIRCYIGLLKDCIMLMLVSC